VDVIPEVGMKNRKRKKKCRAKNKIELCHPHFDLFNNLAGSGDVNF
jgi:hypothetical protein